MVKLCRLTLMCLLPVCVHAQTRSVAPDELILNVTFEEMEHVPYQGEMVLLTIHGIYKRHITLETLQQPDLDGFNWMQLGEDHWYASTLDGKSVKNMRRRMALFPDRAGEIEIGPFRHRLTLLDENNAWFEHTIESEPLRLTVLDAPVADGWWFPVRRLQISDNWSNAPDQLAPGEGVLRIVRVSALGASPDMIPPMPELTSPSALIFPHPEKRLVDLTSKGPESVAFWRWTIKPRNATSAIVEPIRFAYFDTDARQMHEAVISPQRVAYDTTVTGETSPEVAPPDPVRLNAAIVSLTTVAAGLVGVLFGRIPGGRITLDPLRYWLTRLRLRHALRRASRDNDLAALRRAAHRLDALAPSNETRSALLDQLDSDIFAAEPASVDTRRFTRTFLGSLARRTPENGELRT